MRTNLGVCLLFGLAAATSTSYALDNGECGTPAEMTEKFKAAGQRSFASAERIERENGSDVWYGVILTVNADKTVGYILQADKPTGEPASRICIRNRLADIRLFDARKPGLRSEALLAASDEDGRRNCEELVKAKTLNSGTCSPYNRSMKRSEAVGERIIMQGFNVDKQPDGSYRKNGMLTTFAGNVNGTIRQDGIKGVIGGIYFTALPNGATITNMIMIYAEYTPYGLSLLSK